MLLNTIDWPAYIRAMEQLLNVPVDGPRRQELEVQLARMATLAEPLMDFPLPPRQEVSGIYKL